MAALSICLKVFVHFLPGQYYGLRMPQEEEVNCVPREYDSFYSAYISQAQDGQVLKFFGSWHDAHRDGEPSMPGTQFTIVFEDFGAVRAGEISCNVLSVQRDKADCFSFNVFRISPVLLCQGLGGVRILHQVGRFDKIAEKLRQGWSFFRTQAQLCAKTLKLCAKLLTHFPLCLG